MAVAAVLDDSTSLWGRDFIHHGTRDKTFFEYFFKKNKETKELDVNYFVMRTSKRLAKINAKQTRITDSPGQMKVQT